MKLNFEKHILTICTKESRQINAINWILKYIGKKEKEIIINTFAYSHFMYCLLAWHFCSKSSQNKKEKIQYRSLKLITNDYNSDYKFLLNQARNFTVEINALYTLALEIFQTLNNLNQLCIILTESMIFFYTV